MNRPTVLLLCLATPTAVLAQQLEPSDGPIARYSVTYDSFEVSDSTQEYQELESLMWTIGLSGAAAAAAVNNPDRVRAFLRDTIGAPEADIVVYLELARSYVDTAKTAHDRASRETRALCGKVLAEDEGAVDAASVARAFMQTQETLRQTLSAHHKRVLATFDDPTVSSLIAYAQRVRGNQQAAWKELDQVAFATNEPVPYVRHIRKGCTSLLQRPQTPWQMTERVNGIEVE